MSVDTPRSPGPVARFAVYGLLSLSVAWLVFLSVAYFFWPPFLALITILPPFFWAGPGCLLVLVGMRFKFWRASLLVGALWCLFLLIYCEEPRALLTLHRSWPIAGWDDDAPDVAKLRVITLNCSVGTVAAVHEALDLEPDILILQESPSESNLHAITAESPQYSVVYGMDVSILARGTAHAIDADQRRISSIATVTIDGTEIIVTGLRLNPPYFSLAIWDPVHWTRAADSQRGQLSDMQRVWETTLEARGDKPLIVAGDFNAPVGSPVFAELRESLTDAFEASGIGLGNTMLNTMPLARIDRIWLSKELQPQATIARRTIHSDHRMVICDLHVKKR